MRLLALLIGFLLSFTLERSFAADDDEDMFQFANRASAGKSRVRAFPGARDEQGLEVLASLPQPSRNPDGTATVPEDQEAQETAPASD